MNTAKKDITYRHEIMPADREGIRSIIESSAMFNLQEVRIALELVDERLMKGDASGYHFLLAEQAGKVIGYSCFGPVPGTEASFDVYWIAVDRDFRRLGIGKTLLVQTESRIAASGGRRIYIETSSRKQYDSTRLFYQVCGYRVEAVLENFYATGDSKVIYVKEAHVPVMLCASG